MSVRGIEHVQLAIPVGGEDRAREFFLCLLGMREIPKPKTLRPEGAWFEQDGINVHVGIDEDFRPARRSHVAFLVDDVHALESRARAAGYEVHQANPLEGFDRIFVSDPFGNRLEFMQRLNAEAAQ